MRPAISDTILGDCQPTPSTMPVSSGSVHSPNLNIEYLHMCTSTTRRRGGRVGSNVESSVVLRQDILRIGELSRHISNTNINLL